MESRREENNVRGEMTVGQWLNTKILSSIHPSNPQKKVLESKASSSDDDGEMKHEISSEAKSSDISLFDSGIDVSPPQNTGLKIRGGNKRCLDTRDDEILRKKKPPTTEGSSETFVPAPNHNSGNRYENSLFVTTQKFVQLRDITGDRVLNLNEAAQFLSVPKRRLYDITNVLEGINYVEKVGKNSIRFKEINEYDKHVSRLRIHCEYLDRQEEDLDNILRDFQAAFKMYNEDPLQSMYRYVRRSDLKCLDVTGNSTTIAIKSPHDNFQNIEVQMSDPNSTGFYQMIARNKTSQPMNAYLCMQDSDGYASFEPTINSEMHPSSSSCDAPSSSYNVDQKDFGLIEDACQEKYELKEEIKVENLDIGNIPMHEDFVVPGLPQRLESNPSSVPQTPGRGLVSPLRQLLDPSILSAVRPSKDGFLEIDLPALRPCSEMQAPNLVDLFYDEFL